MTGDRPDTLEWFRRMRRLRAFEQRVVELGREGLVAGSIHACGGQEAIPVGARATLRPDDRVVATYRGHGWAIASGVPLAGLVGELCHRAGGVNGGRGGSAYLSAPQHGFVGENSIVGAGVPIGAGLALALRAAEDDAVVVVSIGDGAMNQGATHEGLAFAAAEGLPLILVCENNGWSEMTPISRTARLEDLADRAAAYGIPGAVADGCDPEAVADAVATAAERGRSGGGPTLLEFKTVRLMAHYNGDIEHYRRKADREADAERDPLPRLRALLDEADAERVEREVAEEIEAAVEEARAMAAPDPATARDHVVATPASPPASPATAGEATELTYVQAVNAALRAELAARPEVLVYGEDVGFAGGIFGAARDLQKEFGEARVFDTPIAESAILGSAVGAAMEGMRPIVEIMWIDFMLVALDQLVNQAANARYLSRGERDLPLVVRTQQGVTPGSCAQHSQSLEALLLHVPGLRVGLPSCPQDAYAMLRAAAADPDPCVIIEARALYRDRGPVLLDGPVGPIGGAAVRREGADVALVSWGATVLRAEAAADRLAAEGIAAAVLDLRWLDPLDEATLTAVCRAAGGRVVVAHEANLTGGAGAEIAARVASALHGELAVPVARVATPDVRMPAAPVLQESLVPSAESIAAQARALVQAGSVKVNATSVESDLTADGGSPRMEVPQ